jgi:hypothetical protein
MIGASTFALGVGAAALMSSHGIGRMTAGVITAVLVALAVIAVVWGSAHIIAGVALRRRRFWTRPVVIALGAVDLLLLPYGTALGAYALWILLSEPGRTAFQHATHPQRVSER